MFAFIESEIGRLFNTIENSLKEDDAWSVQMRQKIAEMHGRFP